jgi:hypothetical protein
VSQEWGASLPPAHPANTTRSRLRSLLNRNLVDRWVEQTQAVWKEKGVQWRSIV